MNSDHIFIQGTNSIYVFIIGMLIIWFMYFQYQPRYTSVLTGYVNEDHYEIVKNDGENWTLKKNGYELAKLQATNDEPPEYQFKVKTSTTSNLATGTRIKISAMDGFLLCLDCVKEYISLPEAWGRES
jgi:hypothetical protein